MPKHNELELDHHFWRAISTDLLFHRWFLDKSKFSSSALDLVTDEKWHQRWYRDPETRRDSETDILLMFRDRNNDARCAIHIENKPDHRKWETNQAENYRKRAFNRMSAWRYSDFQIALIAPLSFTMRSPIETGLFDFVASYEDISGFVPEFGPMR